MKLINKYFTISILSLTCATSFALSGNNIDLAHPPATPSMSQAKHTVDQNILKQLKTIFPQLVINNIELTMVSGFWEIKSNLGNIYLNHNGEIIMSGQKVLLLNYQGLDLATNANIIKVVAESVSYPITEDNIDGNLHYFKTKDGVTVITGTDIELKPQAIMGAFSTIKDLKKVKAQLDQKKTVSNPQAVTPQPVQSQAQKPVTAQKVQDGVKQALNFINKNYAENIVKYTATNGNKGTITIFTDYTCPHCQKLHKYINEFLAKGYNVDYILMPRAGKDSPVAAQMTKAMCAVDPRAAVNYLYQHKKLPSDIKERPNCTANAGTNLSIATGFKVQGTPTLVGSNGKISAGFNGVANTIYKLGLGDNNA